MANTGKRASKIAELQAKLAIISQVDWARLAAFIDSEGTIYINSRKVKKYGTIGHSLSVCIPNVSMALLGWLQTTFGGSVCNQGGSPLSKRPIMTWRLNGSRAAAIIAGCFDYFILRREQAIVALQFQEGVTPQWGIQLAELRRRFAAQRAISTLNNMEWEEWQPPKPDEQISFENQLASASPTALAQLASFIDAEGTIYINHLKRKRGCNRHVLSVSVVNSNPRLFTWLVYFGGSTYRHSRSKKQCWRWALTEKNSELVLRYCLPYFIVKREQAELGLALRALIDSENKQEITTDLYQKREECREKIHLLNSPLAMSRKVS